MDDSAERTRVEWREWGDEAFAAADRRGQPILLSLSARWCSHCKAMDRETFDEPRIAANVNDGFVPVRVDADRHPRVRERYNMGGFPSTVFLTPSGKVLSGAGYLGPDGIRGAFDGVREAWDAKGEAAGSVPRGLADEPTPGGAVDGEIEELMVGQLRGTYDERNGGWGEAPKFPMPRTIEFALKREREQALRVANAVSANLLDDYAGGFFRYAENADWSEPHYEKLLDTNAALVRAFANAYLYTGREEYREPAAKTVEYLTTTLWNPAPPAVDGDARGAFCGSQAAGEGADYYAAEPSDREGQAAPPVDPTPFADRNAVAVDALLTYHAYTDDERARRYAERALEYLREHLIDDDETIHYRAPEDEDGDESSGSEGTDGEAPSGSGSGGVDGETRGNGGTGDAEAETGERGLLTDVAPAVRALTTARQVLGADTLGEARALADRAIEALQDDGAFRDGPAEGPGLLDRPLRPLDDNVEMADALLDLAVLTGEDRYREAAHDAVAAFAGARDRLGVRVANYAGVAARLTRPAPTIAVATPAGSDLHRAALRVADHEAVVVPEADGPDYESGHAHVVVGDEVSAPAATPDELQAAVAEHVGE